MEKLKIEPSKKNEKGIALVFSLLMLSLLMILAMSFALDSMFAQKAAYNSANSTSSSFMAQTQLKQILLLMQEDEANFDSDGRLYSHDSGTTTDIDMLVERLPVNGVLKSNDACLGASPNVNWNYIRAANGSIIGRTAFVVVPEDKISLDSLLDERVGTTAYPKHNEGDDTEIRIGKYVSEINVRAAIPSVTTNITTITKTLNWKKGKPVAGAGSDDASGKYTGCWTNFSSLFSTINTAISPDLSDDDETEFKDKLTLAVSKDPEAFWTDLNADTIFDSGELARRFDITRADWKESTGDDWSKSLRFMQEKILLDSGVTGAPTQAMQAWDENDGTALTSGLPWLAAFGYNADGTVCSTLETTFSTISAHRSQIAANLVDYSDTDHWPTSDENYREWPRDGQTPPAFTGNEKTPYISKVGVQIQALQGMDDSADPVDSWATIQIRPYVELINIYKSIPNAVFTNIDLRIRIQGTVKLKVILGGQNITKTVAFADDMALATIQTAAWSGSGRYFFPGVSANYNIPDATDGYFTTAAPADPEVRVDVKNVKITKIVLYSHTSDTNGGYGFDYVKQLNAGTALTEIFKGKSTTSAGYCWYGWAVHDPRQNLNADDWLKLTPQKGDDATAVLSLTGNLGGPYAGMPNSQNTTYGSGGNTVASNAGGASLDPETEADPADGNLSTAIIRNKIMESPWELGFIHRGYRWQTINLKKYDTTKAFLAKSMNGSTEKYIAGGGLYSAGDANILDQIKMTPNAKSQQKINLKSLSLKTFQALFSKIRYACIAGCIANDNFSTRRMAGIETNGNSYAGAIELSSAQIDLYGNNIIDKYKVKVNPDERRTRASVVDQLTPPGGLKDADREEVIGKIINLTKIDPQSGGSFTIIVLAQNIKDIGGTGGDVINVSKYSDNGDPQNANCEIGKFDVHIDGSGDSKDNVYFDEITAEQKIMITGELVNNKFKITSFQYID